MLININDIKNGMTIIMDGKLCQIVEFQHVKPGKGAAFVKMKLRNLKTGSIVEDTYNTNIKVEKAHIDRKPMQYLYSTGDNYVFMDTASYEQIEVPASKLEEEKKYLKEIVTGRSYKDINKMMNDKFEYQFTESQIKGALRRYGLNTGLTGQFTKAHTPWNKGKRGLNIGGKETQFQKGHQPINHRKVGSERITVDGYTEIKVAEPNKWRLKHRVMYEKYHNVKLDPKQLIIFADRDKSNMSKENLLLVDNNQLLVLNRNKLINEDAELTKVGVNVANLIIKIKESNKKLSK